MKKKMLFALVLTLIIVSLGFALFGCGTSVLTYMNENMSEITNVYFYGECKDFYVSISSGEREEPYLIDGKHDKNVDFALLTVKLNKDTQKKVIKVNLSINGENKTYQLIRRGDVENTFMTDLEIKVCDDDEIEFEYDETKFFMKNESKDFAIDSKKAIQIACEQFSNKITECKKWKNLNSEGYLRVLDKKANNFEDLFWCFTIVNINQKSYSIIISTIDGSVMAKSE